MIICWDGPSQPSLKFTENGADHIRCRCGSQSLNLPKNLNQLNPIRAPLGCSGTWDIVDVQLRNLQQFTMSTAWCCHVSMDLCRVNLLKINVWLNLTTQDKVMLPATIFSTAFEKKVSGPLQWCWWVRMYIDKFFHCSLGYCSYAFHHFAVDDTSRAL